MEYKGYCNPRVVAQARQELLRVGRSMASKGLIAGLGGNMSVRLPLGGGAWGILITPSGVVKENLHIDDLLLVDADGHSLQGRGQGNLSSEFCMHQEAYLARPDVGAVVHAHPPATVALTLAGIDLEQVWLPETLLSLGRVGVTPYVTPTTRETAYAVKCKISSHDVVVLPRHGVVTVAGDLCRAAALMEGMEHACKIVLMAKGISPGAPLLPLPQDEIIHIEGLLAQKQ